MLYRSILAQKVSIILRECFTRRQAIENVVNHRFVCMELCDGTPDVFISRKSKTFVVCAVRTLYDSVGSDPMQSDSCVLKEI